MLQPRDSLALAVAQAAGIQRRQGPQPGAEGVGVLQPVQQGMGRVEGKDAPRGVARGFALFNH